MDDIPMEVVRLNMGDIKIEFFNVEGKSLKPGEVVRVHNFRVTGPGIDPMRVRYVKLPILDYNDDGLLVVEIGMWPFDPKNI